MNVFLYASVANEDLRQDAELLDARGYVAITPADVLNALHEPSARNVLRVVCQVILGGRYREPIVAVHPNTDAGALVDLVGFCRAMDVLIVKLEDLPAVAPSTAAVLKDKDLRLGRMAVVVPSFTWTPTLREWLGAIPRLLLRWEARANAWFGDGLKNPVTRELRRRPVEYRLNTTTTTTG